MRFGLKIAHCRDNVKLNAHLAAKLNESTVTDNKEEKNNNNNNDGNNEKDHFLPLWVVDGGITGNCFLKEFTIGGRLGFSWTAEGIRPVSQVRTS